MFLGNYKYSGGTQWDLVMSNSQSETKNFESRFSLIISPYFKDQIVARMRLYPVKFPDTTGILRDVNSCLMQTLSFVLINSHRCWPREWKHSIHVYKVFKIQVLQSAYFRFSGDWPCPVSLTFPISRLGFACGSGVTSHDHPPHPEKTELQSALGCLTCILHWR